MVMVRIQADVGRMLACWQGSRKSALSTMQSTMELCQPPGTETHVAVTGTRVLAAHTGACKCKAQENKLTPSSRCPQVCIVFLALLSQKSTGKPLREPQHRIKGQPLATRQQMFRA